MSQQCSVSLNYIKLSKSSWENLVTSRATSDHSAGHEFDTPGLGVATDRQINDKAVDVKSLLVMAL